MSEKRVYLGYATRTPVLEFGSPAKLTAPELGVLAVRGVLDRSRLPGHAVDEVIMGQVIQLGSGSYPHRQVVLNAGLPASTPARLVREECSSGLTSIYTAYDALTGTRSSAGDIIIAGGMENMRVPRNVKYDDIKEESQKYPAVGKDALKEEAKIIDTLLEGLKNSTPDSATGEYLNTIQCAERCAKKFGITREEIDEYALRSWMRAFAATERLTSLQGITPIHLRNEKGEIIETITEDEAPVKFNPGNSEGAWKEYANTLRAWKPLPGCDVITPLNASRRSHGAAAMLVFTDKGIRKARAFGIDLKPQARIVAIDRLYQAPEEFPETPWQLLRRSVIDLVQHGALVETNEAFPPVCILAERKAGINPELHNIHGGAVSRGHPLGATGSILLTRLLYNMRRMQKRFGAVVLCVGGGGGTMIVVERV